MRSRKPEDLQPEAAAKCSALMGACKAEGITLAIISTRRTQEEQDALYAQGRMPIDAVNSLRTIAGLGPITHEANRIVTTTRRSAHLEGRAFDMAVIKDDRLSWNAISEYERAGAIGKALGLRWGGDFSKLRDLGHFELSVDSLALSVDSLALSVDSLAVSVDSPKLSVDSLDLPIGSPALPLGDPATSAHPTHPTHNRAAHGPINESQQEDTHMQETSTVKSGLRSSEFYLALIGAVTSVLNGHLGLSIPTEGLLSLAGIVISYVISRTAIKKAAA